MWNKKYLFIILVISIFSSYLLLEFTLDKAKNKNFKNLALGKHTESIFEKYNTNSINFWNFTVPDRGSVNPTPLGG
jgi:hypothetical protein